VAPKSSKLTDEGPSKTGKVESRGTGGLHDDAPFAAIVKVRQPGYVPKGIVVRAQLGPTLFTADLTAGSLAQLEADPQVDSIAPAERLAPLSRGPK